MFLESMFYHRGDKPLIVSIEADEGWTLPKFEKRKNKGNMIWDYMFLSAFVTIIIKKKKIIYLIYHLNGYPI